MINDKKYKYDCKNKNMTIIKIKINILVRIIRELGCSWQVRVMYYIV